MSTPNNEAINTETVFNNSQANTQNSIFAKSNGKKDWPIFIVVISLLFFSVPIVYHASAHKSMTQAKVDQDTNEPIITANKYVKSHLRNVIISLLLLFFFAKFDYNLLHKLAKPIFLVAILFLILVKLVGDMRTIPLYFIGFHPTELAKFAIVIFFSAMIVKHQNNTKSFNDFYLPAIFWLGVVSVLILLQPNLSNAVLIFAVGMIMLFIGNANMKHLLTTAFIGLLIAFAAAMKLGYTWTRVTMWFQSIDSLEGTVKGDQMYNAIVALGSGGLLGLGTSNQSYGHLPVPHSDHIFNVIGEIYGFIALTLLSIGFVVILFRGFNIARNSVNPFGYYLALGIVFQIMLNFIVIFGLCIGILIQTGLPLPFLSYGGNALIFYSIEIGVLLNIGVQSQKVSTKPTIVDRFNRVFRTS